jgi:glycerophosphoryl diester phosphodiesterase
MDSNTTPILNIAHRGARSLAPENTLAAARKALEIGADMWELDVALSADGEIVVLHDDTLERTSNVAEIFPGRAPWRIHEFTLEEIRRLDFGSWFVQKDPFGQIAAGQVTPAELQSYTGEPAPTLRQALEITRQNNWSVNVEIKDVSRTPGDAIIVEKVAGLVKEMEMTNRVIISSFNHTYLQQSKQVAPEISTAALVSWPNFAPAHLLRRLGAQSYHPDANLILPGSIRRLRNAGFGVNIWTVNDQAVMRRLIKAGASGIITDFPQLLKKVLKD